MVLAIFLVGFLVGGAALAVEILYRPPYWLHAALWAPAIVLSTLGLLRPLKALFVAYQFRHDAHQQRGRDGGDS